MADHQTNVFSAGDDALASEVNTNFSQIFDELLGQYTYGETIGTKKAVYIDTNSKLGLCDSDNNDKKINNFIGISFESGVLDDIKHIQTNGLVSGLSGLVAGSEYYLAKAGTSQSDIDRTDDNSGTDTNIGEVSGSEYRRAFTFTLSNPAKLADITVRLKKVSSPTGNIVIALFAGSPSKINNKEGGGSSLSKEVSSSASALTTSYADVVFDFGNFELQAGSYYFLVYHDTLSNNNYVQMQGKSANDTDNNSYLSGTWTTNSGDTYYYIDFVAETFALGDLTTYFYDFPKLVGVAISSTELLLLKNGKQKNKLTNSGYTTRDVSSASGRQTIAHGLGKKPIKIKLNALIGGTTGGVVPCHAFCVYNGKKQDAVSSYYNGTNNDVIDEFVLGKTNSGTSYNKGTVSFDDTNIYIDWTLAGSPTGTFGILWEAETE